MPNHITSLASGLQVVSDPARHRIGGKERDNRVESVVLSTPVPHTPDRSNVTMFRHKSRALLALLLPFVFVLGWAQLLNCMEIGPNQAVLPPAAEEERARQANAWNKQGMAFYSTGNYYAAAQAFRRVYSLYPDNPDVAFNYGIALQTLGRFESALAPLLKGISARPEDSAAHLSLGVCYLGLGRFPEGVVALEESLRGDPSNIQALFYLAIAYHKLNRDADANERLRWMAERNPQSPLTYLYTARALRMASKFTEAEEVILKSLELDPRSAEAYFERGCIERLLSHPEEAAKAFQEALRIHPEMPNAYIELGEVTLDNRIDPDAAMWYFRKALELNPDDARGLFDLGDCYLKKHEMEEAQKALEHAIEIDSHLSRAHYLLGSILQRQGRNEEASREFAQARALGKQEHDPPIRDFQTPLAPEKESAESSMKTH